MKNILTIPLLLLAIGAFGQKKPKFIKHADTVTIYKNGNRRVVIDKKVTFYKAKENINFGTVDNIILYLSSKN